MRKARARSWMWEHVRDNHAGKVGESGGKHDYNVKMTGRFGLMPSKASR